MHVSLAASQNSVKPGSQSRWCEQANCLFTRIVVGCHLSMTTILHGYHALIFMTTRPEAPFLAVRDA